MMKSFKILLIAVMAGCSGVAGVFGDDGAPDTIQMRVDRRSDGAAEVQVGWPSGLSDRLEIYSTTNLASGIWQCVCSNIATCGGAPFSWTDSGSNGVSCFYVTGNADLDEDGDGLASAREIFLYQTQATLFDTDGDGLGDGWEMQYGLNPRHASFSDALNDADGDGFSALEEAAAGTDPHSADPHPLQGQVATIRYYYDEDDRLTDHFIDEESARKTVLSAAGNIKEDVSVSE